MRLSSQFGVVLEERLSNKFLNVILLRRNLFDVRDSRSLISNASETELKLTKNDASFEEDIEIYDDSEIGSCSRTSLRDV
jgi:hypothetical protein